MELYNSQNMPLSSEPRLRTVQEKILRGEQLTMSDKLIAGRDHPIKEINGYQLKTDHAYRAISESMFQLYKEKGVILGSGIDDEYLEYEENGKTFNNNKGVDWYLGGAELKYGDIILECPADMEYFMPAFDNGSRMSFDPTVRFLKSSGNKKPIPISMITRVFDVKLLKEKNNKLNHEEFLKLRDLDRQRLAQLRQQQLINSMTTLEQEQLTTGGISR